MYLSSEYAQIEIKVKIDMWVNFHNGATYLIHFKNKNNNVERNPADHDVVQAECEKFCAKSNLNFHVIDQNLPEFEPRKSNINLLWSYARRDIHLGHLWLINRFFTDEPSPNIGKFKQALASHDFDPDLIYTFLIHHAVDAEITRFPLTDETPLTKDRLSNIQVEQIKLIDDFEESTQISLSPEVF